MHLQPSIFKSFISALDTAIDFVAGIDFVILLIASLFFIVLFGYAAISWGLQSL
jgi:hypothetical protein